jgi:FdhD protein
VEPLFTTKITKVKGGEKFETNDTLVREIKLELFVNGERAGAVMSTPIDQEALAVGYLMSENIIQKASDITSVRLINDGMGVEVNSRVNYDGIKRLNAEGVVMSGCGKSLTSNIDPEAINAKVIQSGFRINASDLLAHMKEFYLNCPLYEQTGCVHTAKLFVDENTFFIGEDIAQHNTIDKVTGKAALAGKDISNSFLMVSGRLSSEMVAKCVMHGIPILVSRTACTCLGYMIAKKFNLTLVGFAREDKMNIYFAQERIYV